MLPSYYFDYIFVHLGQKARLRPELSPKFWSTLGPNPARTRPEKPGLKYKSEVNNSIILFLSRNSSQKMMTETTIGA